MKLERKGKGHEKEKENEKEKEDENEKENGKERENEKESEFCHFWKLQSCFTTKIPQIVSSGHSGHKH